MAVVLRLRRHGANKKPFYRIVAADSRRSTGGSILESFGTYDPKSKEAKVSVKEDRALFWLERGAKPSQTVRSILSTQGLMKKFFESKKKA